MRLDKDRMALVHDDKVVFLTARECAFVGLLINRPGVVYTRNQIMDECWDMNGYIYDRSVDSLIKRVRRKMTDAYGFQAIMTRYGAGYSWEMPAG